MESKTTTEPKVVGLRLTLFHDSDASDPIEDDESFTLVRFIDNRDPSARLEELKDKIQPESEGKSWWKLSCYRHGNEYWYVAGTSVYECPWDTTKTAGLLVLTSPPEDFPDLESTVESVVREYDDWLNGRVYGYSIDRDVETVGPCPHCGKGDDVVTPQRVVSESFCGFIGDSYAADEAAEDLHSDLVLLNRESSGRTWKVSVEDETGILRGDVMKRLSELLAESKIRVDFG